MTALSPVKVYVLRVGGDYDVESTIHGVYASLELAQAAWPKGQWHPMEVGRGTSRQVIEGRWDNWHDGMRNEDGAEITEHEVQGA